MKKRDLAFVSSAQALSALAFLFFCFTLLNGYLLNLIADYHANEWLVLAGVIGELALALGLARRFVGVQFDPLELAGFLLVVLGVWQYLIVAAQPTLLPPSLSTDAVRAYQQVLFSYPEGKLAGWYPPGGAFIVAMIAHWFAWAPLRVLHPVAASFAALSAGAVYGMTCALLPQTRLAKIAALVAPALLFITGSGFAGALNWEQYLFAPVLAQYGALIALWFTASYARAPHWVFAVMIGAAWFGVIATQPVFVILPLIVFALAAAGRIGMMFFVPAPAHFDDAPESLTQVAPRPAYAAAQILVTLGILFTLIALILLGLQIAGILALSTGGNAPGVNVYRSWFEYLGWLIVIALAGGGIWFAWRHGAFGRVILGFTALWFAQRIGLFAFQAAGIVSGASADKTIYALVFPLAILGALVLARGISFVVERAQLAARARYALSAALVGAVIVFAVILRPPIRYSPLTESEIKVAYWAKDFFNNTYQINYLDDQPASAYWLIFGMWNEPIPLDGSRWSAAPRVLAPAAFEDWLEDAGWGDRLLVRYVEEVPVSLRVLYQAGSAAILEKDLPPILDPQPPERADYNFDNTLTLLGYSIPKTTFAPGETVILTTYTQSLYAPPALVRWRAELVDRNNKMVQHIERDPFGDKYPLQRWPPGKYKRENWEFPLDAKIAPGTYTLRLELFRPEDDALIPVVPVYATSLAASMSAAPLAKITIATPAKQAP